MRFPCAFVEIVSDFSGFHHPHLHVSKSASQFSTSSAPSRIPCSPSRHSLNIPVGVDDVPTVPHHYTKNSCTPVVSRVASFSSLHEKVLKLKTEENLTDAGSRKTSITSSYRVIH